MSCIQLQKLLRAKAHCLWQVSNYTKSRQRHRECVRITEW